VTFDRIAVRERHAPPRRVARICPVAGFEQNGVEHPELDHFAGHAVDLHPIAEADAVFPHEHEPTEETHDESFNATVRPAPARPTIVPS